MSSNHAESLLKCLFRPLSKLYVTSASGALCQRKVRCIYAGSTVLRVRCPQVSNLVVLTASSHLYRGMLRNRARHLVPDVS
ncbi:hypothetical protein PC120_g20809 [Phytophthora cactorum]|nr:hypothetical protein PC120_g20809 [Phytophthora cactorum]